MTCPAAEVHSVTQGPAQANAYATPEVAMRPPVNSDMSSAVMVTAYTLMGYSQAGVSSTTLPPCSTNAVTSFPVGRRKRMKSYCACCPAHSQSAQSVPSSGTHIARAASDS